MLARALPEDREHAVDEITVRRDVVVVSPPEPQSQILLHRQFLEEAPILGNVNDTEPRDRLRLPAVDPPPAERDLTLLRLILEQAGDRPEQRRLAGAVGPEHREDLSLLDLE